MCYFSFKNRILKCDEYFSQIPKQSATFLIGTMFFPYNTDAPIYYLPIITVCIIVVNIFAFGFELAYPEQIEPFTLEVGNGLHPLQWLTSNFLHADIMHLLSNMLSFWAFGLVVEGKLGLIKTLCVYLGIGVIYGAVVQILMLSGNPGHCLGASAIIFGMMAMCLIWAPENSMECVLFIFVRPFFFDVRIKTLVGLFLGLQILVLILTGGQLSSEFLHTVGAAVGFVAGILLLKSGQVDCENWDIFSVWAGRHQMTDVERRKHDQESPKAKQQKIEQINKRQNMLVAGIRSAIQDGTPLPAYIIAQKIVKEFPDMKIPELDLLHLIRLLLERELWVEAITMMQEYLKHYTEKAIVIRLSLAHILVKMNKPRTAIKFLVKIDFSLLDDSQRKSFHSLIELAKRTAHTMDQQGVYELVDDL
ncbi:MAG: rhomboid family intramembrane serine protease [Planctomycetaceae bacterium]|jgi:membrane associated rhomboid family serine protease|nr:rhomboid family intramembrane serine protease [Planctomycetaceae bacterium]